MLFLGNTICQQGHTYAAMIVKISSKQLQQIWCNINIFGRKNNQFICT